MKFFTLLVLLIFCSVLIINSCSKDSGQKNKLSQGKISQQEATQETASPIPVETPADSVEKFYAKTLQQDDAVYLLEEGVAPINENEIEPPPLQPWEVFRKTIDDSLKKIHVKRFPIYDAFIISAENFASGSGLEEKTVPAEYLALIDTIQVIAGDSAIKYETEKILKGEGYETLLIKNEPWMLRPAAFKGLPPEISYWLERRGYVIPQGNPPMSYKIVEVGNAIQGQFIRPGQEDWAVYATNGAYTAVFIFYNGSVDEIEVMDASPESRLYQEPPNDDKSLTCCKTLIFTATKEDILIWHKINPGSGMYVKDKPPPVIDHHGIDRGWYSGSNIMYKYQGKWLTLAGGD